MFRWVLLGSGLTLGLLFVCPAGLCADAPATEPKQVNLTEAAALVQKLGDKSFEVRRNAHKELQDMGRGVEKILRDNLNNSDLEISSRCERLLILATRSETEIALDAFLQNKDDKLLMKLPSWSRFSEMTGKETASRLLFVEMYSSETQLLDALEKDPKSLSGPNGKFTARCQQLQQILWTPWGTQGNISVSQVVGLLFVASDPRMTFDINTFYLMTNFLYQQNIQQGFKSDPASRKVLTAFIEKRADQNTLPQIMPLILQMELKEMVPVALKMALDKNTQAYSKATAVMIVGQMGSKDDAAKLEPLLANDTNLGSATFGTTTVTAQLKDVALAAMIEANGLNPVDYDFPYLKAVQVQGPYRAPVWYGFTDQKGRDAAMKKFKDWQAKQVKK
jgi:hypothetical protein